MTESMDHRYLALPPSGQGAGVLVLHPWWGLNDFMRAFCDRLAQAGYTALAPDLFSGRTAHTIAEAEELLMSVGQEPGIADKVVAALDELRQHPAVKGGPLAVVGFSFGAYWALWLAVEQPAALCAVTLFYGTNGGEGDFTASQAAYLGHFAADDPYEAPETVAELEKVLRAADRPTAFYTYPHTGHWFFESDRPDAYQPQAAQLAWERTLAFLQDSFQKDA